ncbi:MarR family winged helix-turn-helix transcriptional regulator [Streptomyces morookaense]|uniref:MarR family transcriptional regulator n=1 Tax=Streptomyces morookaense TaxID=1970 RepID=A0A7Y7B1W9_STRMO|nr:MarR family transcriptional regulator [Streptomyces morookaense]NVK77518.1 MarR family transcriptional regulator [Streptomyces morookaense]GHF22233.1 MarR family transcriptional regulator [Streptomyces morookaense]
MSSEEAKALRDELADQARALQTAVDAVDAAAAERLGVNRTDLACLDVLMQRGSAAPTELGAALKLTTGSVTTMLDRLVRTGYVTRAPDPADRRKAVIQPTEQARRRLLEIYGPLAEEGRRMIDRYSVDEVKLLLDFMRASREAQEHHMARIRG